jgi:hypothetical protein
MKVWIVKEYMPSNSLLRGSERGAGREADSEKGIWHFQSVANFPMVLHVKRLFQNQLANKSQVWPFASSLVRSMRPHPAF